MEVFGYNVNLTEVLEVAKYAAPALIVGTAGYKLGQRYIDRILNRQFDTALVSVTTPSEINTKGRRFLSLDNFGKAVILEVEVRGADVKKLMIAGAKRCDWSPTGRFVNLQDDESQRLMFEVVRNWLTEFWKDGVRDKLDGVPVDTDEGIFFAITGSDNKAGSTRKFRIIIIRAEHAQIYLKHPEDMWDYQEGHHDLRLQTVQLMSEAILNGTNCIKIDGKEVQIVQFIRTYRRMQKVV